MSTAQRMSHVKHVTPLIGNELGPTRQDGHRTLRKRVSGKRELPLPPLLDPVVIEARTRHMQKKEKPRVADLTPFQRKLWENPFAHALASPVRECFRVNHFLPSDLLISLHLRPHNGDPWLVPLSLTTDKKHLGLPLRFLNRQLVLGQLSKGGLWKGSMNSHPRFSAQLEQREKSRVFWRSDMSQLILDLLRKRVVGRLSWNFSFRGRLIPVASPRAEDLEAVDDVSTVLYFGSLRTRADDVHDRCRAITVELEKWATYFGKDFGHHFDPHAAFKVVKHNKPWWALTPLVPHMQPRLQFPELEYKTATWRGKKVALYSLTDMLGAEKAQELISGPDSKYADQRCVVIKRGRHNTPVEKLLMQLQSYIAKPGV
ncbi:hypothetical protein E8E13_002763 [Curvularia kusanoi]|uniref:Uncharacterized protein n=1 Tax=Curvularia kusanoi TaxID=90978 RepID=A0A9P4THS7_CURKU|nr:hypothetical protein E8E13_002763 [Curvularia kusanoi]